MRSKRKRKFIIPGNIHSDECEILICSKCGNYKDFRKNIFGHSPFTKEVTYEISKGKTKLVEGDVEYEEEDFDGSSEWECTGCGETIIEIFEDYETFMEYISEHVTKDLLWSEEVVKIKNPRILKYIMVSNL